MTSQISRELNGHATDILVQRFADRVLILVTQLGKVGTMVILRLDDHWRTSLKATPT